MIEDYRHELGPGCEVIVPRGYVTNFGTVPRLFRLVSPGELAEAAIVHDWMSSEDLVDATSATERC